MSNPNEIHALIHLLDDDDKDVYRHVHDKLLSFGTQIIPTLEQAWGSELNPATHERLEEIIHEIQFTTLLGNWDAWLAKDQPDLLTGAFLVAQYHYPEIHFEEIQKKVTKLKQSIWLELNYNQTALEQIQIFNQVFYNIHKFRGAGATPGFNDFCLNHTLETKQGNSIMLGILYQLLAAELSLPVYGVCLQRHYILAFCKKTIPDFDTPENLEREVMFYINPVNRGSIFSRNEIKDYLEKLKAEHGTGNFTPASNRTVIKELLHYLMEVYQQHNNEEKLKELRVLVGKIN